MHEVQIIANSKINGESLMAAKIEIEGEKITLNDLWEECESNLKHDNRFFPGTMKLKIRKKS